jgi:hypothetical protein
MKLLLENATEIAKGVWLTQTPSHQITRIGTPKTAQGRRSVLLASSPAFDLEQHSLVLDADAIVVLNVGTTAATVIIDPTAAEETDAAERGETSTEQGPGDSEFLSMVERELRGEALEVGVDLLRAVRQRSPGDLKRGELNNFSNTPDNFWYVIVQPRVQALSITVRGKPDKFGPSSLDLREDRPGYTRFKLQLVEQLPEALRIIFWHLDHGIKRRF